jgi:hypothetical protein
VPTAHVNEIDIYFEHSGQGRRLLIFNGSSATIESTGPLIDPYRARFDVLIHDQRGLGRTEIPPGPYSMKDYAADASVKKPLAWPLNERTASICSALPAILPARTLASSFFFLFLSLDMLLPFRLYRLPLGR